jgi:MarR family transcriptional regulator, organic hydroperoxide resistance regulator
MAGIGSPRTLLEDRWTTWRRDDQDNRLVRLWLTDAGRALREPVEAQRQWLEEQVTADLTETEREYLMSALAKIHGSALALLDGPADHPGRAATRPG